MIVSKNSTTMPRYGFTLQWTSFDGWWQAIEVWSDTSFEECNREALRIAKECGWTKPKWWQWWRWSDNGWDLS